MDDFKATLSRHELTDIVNYESQSHFIVIGASFESWPHYQTCLGNFLSILNVEKPWLLTNLSEISLLEAFLDNQIEQMVQLNIVSNFEGGDIVCLHGLFASTVNRDAVACLANHRIDLQVLSHISGGEKSLTRKQVKLHFTFDL